MADHQEASVTLPSDPASVSAARAYVRTYPGGVGTAAADADIADTVRLIVSELATNAVQHTFGQSPTFTVDIQLDRDERLRIGVTDSHPRFPKRLPAAVQQDNGRGMVIIRWLTAECGGKLRSDPPERAARRSPSNCRGRRSGRSPREGRRPRGSPPAPPCRPPRPEGRGRLRRPGTGPRAPRWPRRPGAGAGGGTAGALAERWAGWTEAREHRLHRHGGVRGALGPVAGRKARGEGQAGVGGGGGRPWANGSPPGPVACTRGSAGATAGRPAVAPAGGSLDPAVPDALRPDLLQPHHVPGLRGVPDLALPGVDADVVHVRARVEEDQVTAPCGWERRCGGSCCTAGRPCGAVSCPPS